MTKRTPRVSFLALLVPIAAFVAGGTAYGASHTFTVTDAGDGGDTMVGDGNCGSGAMGAPPCTYRAAIQEANDILATNPSDTVTIQFSGVTTITPATSYPSFGYGGVTLNGGASKVVLDGGTNNVNGPGISFAVAAADTRAILIENMEVSHFNGDGIDVSGTGVAVGTLGGGGCIVRGNNGIGIAVSGFFTTATIQNSYIGMMSDGLTPDGNANDGIDITAITGVNAVSITNNVISGNGTSTGGGIHIGSGTGVAVTVNFIGLDKLGQAISNQIGNGDYGIKIDGGAGHVIGAGMIMTPNWISHNGYNGNTPPSNTSADGIQITGSAQGVLVQGNIIGLDSFGMAAPNGRDGLFISTNNNLIGAAGNFENVISGNVRNGITLQSSSATANVIYNNVIGEDMGADVTEIARPNGGAGIQLTFSAHDNSIGDTAVNTFNIVAHNTGNGIEFRNSGTGNKLSANHIHDNGKLGIDIDFPADAVNPIDAGDTDTGSNNEQNYPTLLTAVISGSTTQITGTLDSTVGDTFNLEFFDSPAADSTMFMGQPYGEGRNYLGNAMVMIPAAAMSPTPFNVMIGSAATAGHFITATATRVAAPLDTSEFSNAIQAITPVELQSFEVE